MRLAAFAATLLVTASAQANGRFPSASQLVFDPSDPAHAVVRSTFGLLQTTDGGASWQWVCEKAMGFEGTFDPAIAISGTGAIHVGLPDGMSSSNDRACGFRRIAGDYVIDLAIDPASPNHLVAVTALSAGSPMGSTAKLLRSNDGGATWEPPRVLPEDFKPLTVEVTKGRIYASGLAPFVGLGMLARSDDGGATWTERTFEGRDAYIAGVDRNNADRVYLRIDGESDELRFSGDGGSTFSTLMIGGELLGFALAADGTVAVGGAGVFVSGPDHAFKKVSDRAVRCLTFQGATLWSCTTDPDQAVLRADEVKLRLAELIPLACANATCARYWPEVSRTFAPVDAGPAPPSPAPSVIAGGGGCNVSGPSSGASVLVVALLLLRRHVR